MDDRGVTTKPLDLHMLHVSGYEKTVYCMHAGGMTVREIAREVGMHERDVRRVIVKVWALDLDALKAEKELAKLIAKHAKQNRKRAKDAE